MAKQIIITIDKAGNSRVETTGFAGPECEQETAALEAALGARTSNTRTGEYRNRPDNVRTVNA